MKTPVILSLITLLLTSMGLYAQPDWNTQGNTGTSPVTDFVGTTDTRPLQFGTNGAFPQAILDVTGFVGIGSNLGTYTPIFDLDVLNTINVNNDGNPIGALGVGYFIGGNMVLQIPGTRNTFGGVNAGSNWTTGEDNTFYGSNAGNQNNIGRFNTFIGSNAGSANDKGDFNTYVGNLSGTNNQGESNSFFGHHSGFNTNGGNFNTFIGEHAGFGSTSTLPTGSHNTFVGNRAGQNYATARDNAIVGDLAGDLLFSGFENAFLGNLAGRFNTTGSRNTFIGFRAGQNNATGTDLTLIGHQTTAQASPAISNATAIGANATVVTSNTMILGTNDINIGIGLSGNASGPQTKLEILAGVNSSGLRFRSLTSASPSCTVYTKFLTVNGAGDVILGDVPGSGGAVGSCSGGLPAASAGFITKITAVNEICKTEGIFESATGPNTVGIGLGSSPNTSMKVDVGGDLLIRPNVTYNMGGDIFMTDASSAVKRVLSMYGLSGFGALAIGHDAGNAGTHAAASTSVTESVFIGKWAGASIPSISSYNTLIGHLSGFSLSASEVSANTFVGARSGRNLTQGNNNVIVGHNSGNGSASGAGMFTSGNGNTFVGNACLVAYLPSANANTVIGNDANIITDAPGTNPANNNILIGAGTIARDDQTTSGPDDIQHAVVIGTNGLVTCDSCFILGNSNVHRVGIGRTVAVLTTILDVDPKAHMAWAAIFRDTAIQVNTVHVPSDHNIKEQIVPISGILNTFDSLNAYSYRYRKEDFPQIGIDGGFHYGLMAQELEQVFPWLVTDHLADAINDTSGNELHPAVEYKTVNYMELIPLLIQAFKEQKHVVDSLANQISALQLQINPNGSVRSIGENMVRSSLTLSNNESIILNQNVPNPFADKTEITYNIPESVQSAVIMFYDQSGRILQKFDIGHRGAGSLTVYSDDLTSGIYSYALVVDGKNHQTKRMLKQ
jgi:trimeric autotransporter adhesin